MLFKETSQLTYVDFSLAVLKYQLEHHLFPSMPRNKYPLLRQKLIQFSQDLNIPGGYRESGEWDILRMNWQLYKRVAQADAVPGAPLTRGRQGQQGAIFESSSPAADAAARAEA